MGEPQYIPLICMLVTELAKPLHGTIQGKCSKCGVDIWISPAGQDKITDEDNVRPYCIRCGRALVGMEIKKFGNIGIIQL